MSHKYLSTFLTVLLLSSSTSQSSELAKDKPWDDFVGCYKTLKYKGRKIKNEAKNENLTIIETDSSDFFKDVRKIHYLPILKIITFRGDPKRHQRGFGYYQTFLDRGQFVQVKNGFNYYVSSDVQFGSVFDGFRKINYESTVSLKEQGDLVELKVVIRSNLKSEELLNQSGTYLFKPISCP